MYAFFSSMVFRKWETNRIGRFRGTKNIPTSFYIWRTGFVHPRELGGNEKRKIGRRKYGAGDVNFGKWSIENSLFYLSRPFPIKNFSVPSRTRCVCWPNFILVSYLHTTTRKKNLERVFDMRRVQSFSTYPFYGRPSSIGLFLLRLNLEGFDLVKKNIFFSLRPSVCQLVLQIVVPPILHIPPNICTSIVQRNWLWSKECSCEIWKFILFLFNGIPK